MSGLIISVCGPPVSSNRIASSRNPARLVDPRLQHEDLSLIQERCEKNWPDDVRMHLQAQQEMRAFQKLQGPPPKYQPARLPVAVAQCSKDFPEDYRLRARCMDEQIAEKRRHQEPIGSKHDSTITRTRFSRSG